MNNLVERKCSICGDSYSVPRNETWKILCPKHTEEYYIPLRKCKSYREICTLIELATMMNDLDILRGNFKKSIDEKPCLNKGFQKVVGTAAYQKLKSQQSS